MPPRVPLPRALRTALRVAALLLLLPLGAAAAQEPAPSAPPPGPPSDDVLAALVGTPEARARADSAAAAQRRFLLAWRDAWFATEDARRPAGYATESEGEGPVARRLSPARAERFTRDTPFRLRALHCHGDGSYGVGVLARMIPSVTSPRSYCPGWLPDSVARPDESLVIDSALAPQHRAAIAAERRRIIARLDSVAYGVPRSDWLYGQRVRLRVDDGDLDGALAVARGCTGSPAWCAMLAGWVHERRGEMHAADSAFATASAALPAPARCGWEDARMLLDSLGRRIYETLGCSPARDSANARLWWLADPLYAEPGNERRVAHHARQVGVTLRAAVGIDERHDWTPPGGGDALAETIARYGWPSYELWGGTPHDSGHTRWIESFDGRGSAPYAALEYGRRGRAHVLPAWRAVGDPFASAPDDWTLQAPAGTRAESWWPVEHFARRAGPLVQLPEGQVATVRRHGTAFVAVAVDLDTALLERAAGTAVPAVLLLGRGEHEMMPVTEVTAPVGGRVVLAAPLSADSALLAVEVGAGAPGTAARTRFGFAPPPTLAALADGEIAVSEPILLDPGLADTPLREGADVSAALERMLGTTRLRGAARLGVYWESYGVAPGDTVDVAVRVVRDERAGTMRRLATALGLADDPSGSVAVRWREPRGAPTPAIPDGPVPIQPRSVVLDLSRLAPGDYLLEVSIARPGQPPASARRPLTIESPVARRPPEPPRP